MYIKNVNWDHVRIGARVLLGGEPHRKVAPMMAQNEATKAFVYDARLIPAFAHVDPPLVDVCTVTPYEDRDL